MESTKAASGDKDLVETSAEDKKLKETATNEGINPKSGANEKMDIDQDKAESKKPQEVVKEELSETAVPVSAGTEVSANDEHSQLSGITSDSGEIASSQADKAKVDAKKSLDDKSETQKTDGDSEQLEVLVDDTQNDLDADLLSGQLAKTEAAEVETSATDSEPNPTEKADVPAIGTKEEKSEGAPNPGDPVVKTEEKKDVGDDKNKRLVWFV